MMLLADTSAWIVADRTPELRAAFDRMLLAGEIGTCDMVKLELLRGARNPREFATVRSGLESVPQVPIRSAAWTRALDVYGDLAAQRGSHHRRASHPDLLIAAAAEAAGVPVLHYDSDYDTIAGITGQSTRWIAPRGTF